MEGGDGECSEAYRLGGLAHTTVNKRLSQTREKGKTTQDRPVTMAQGPHSCKHAGACIWARTHTHTGRDFFFLRKKKPWIFICSRKWELKFRETKEFSQKQTCREDTARLRERVSGLRCSCTEMASWVNASHTGGPLTLSQTHHPSFCFAQMSGPNFPPSYAIQGLVSWLKFPIPQISQSFPPNSMLVSCLPLLVT